MDRLQWVLIASAYYTYKAARGVALLSMAVPLVVAQWCTCHNQMYPEAQEKK